MAFNDGEFFTFFRKKIHRKYDPFDRLIEEEIHPGIVLCYTYDPIDRLTRLFLPDGSSILYYYTGPHLNAIGRHNANGHSAYHYDPNGSLIAQFQPHTLYRYDALNRLTTIVKRMRVSTL